MVLRIEGDNLIECDIGDNNTEEDFVGLNPDFIIESNVPYSLSGYYIYDEDGTTIVVDPIKELQELKATKMNDILYKFDDMMFHGQFDCSLGFRTDNRRGDGKDDKDNVASLIDLGNEPVYFRDSNNGFHVLSLADLTLLKQEMIYDGLGKYQWKWTKENEVMSTATCVELEQVKI